MTHRSLKAFARWMLNDDRLAIRPDLTKINLFRGIVIETIVYRDDPYQAEIVMVTPGGVIPRHRHNKAESLELALGGGAVGAFIGDVAVKQRQRGTLMANLVRVPRGVWHGGAASQIGCVWISFQRWYESPIGFLTEDWEE